MTYHYCLQRTPPWMPQFLSSVQHNDKKRMYMYMPSSDTDVNTTCMAIVIIMLLAIDVTVTSSRRVADVAAAVFSCFDLL